MKGFNEKYNEALGHMTKVYNKSANIDRHGDPLTTQQFEDVFILFLGEIKNIRSILAEDEEVKE